MNRRLIIRMLGALLLIEAVAMVPGMGDDKKGKVIDCLQTGYQLNEKVIRHAKVAVGQ